MSDISNYLTNLAAEFGLYKVCESLKSRF